MREALVAGGRAARRARAAAGRARRARRRRGDRRGDREAAPAAAAGAAPAARARRGRPRAHPRAAGAARRRSARPCRASPKSPRACKICRNPRTFLPGIKRLGEGPHEGNTPGSRLRVLTTAVVGCWPSQARRWRRRSPSTAPTTGWISTPATGFATTPDESCTLRAAIMEANALAGADTIALPAGTYPLDLFADDGSADSGEEAGDLDVRDDLTLTGAGAATTDHRRPGNEADRGRGRSRARARPRRPTR